MEVPDFVWRSLVGLLGAATLYLGFLVKKGEAKPKEPSQSLRAYIDLRAEHKVNNAVGAILPKLIAPLQTDLNRYGSVLDRLSGSERDHGERLVHVETTLDEVVRRLEREREESLNTMRRIELKVDSLLTGEKYRG